MLFENLPIDPALYKWVLLPALIFFARICDVTIGTIRIIFVSRSMRFLAPLLGFFEALTWLLAIGQIMQNLSDIYCYMAYATGFAAGNYIGIWFENRLAVGVSLIRIILHQDADHVVDHLKEKGLGITSYDAESKSQPVKVVFAIVKRREIDKVIEPLKSKQPSAIYTIEDVRSASPQALQLEAAA